MTGTFERDRAARRRSGLAIGFLVGGAIAGSIAAMSPGGDVRPGQKAGPAIVAPATVRSRYLMGTVLTVAVDGRDAVANVEAAFAEVARLERVLSNWQTDSEVSRLNRAVAREPVRCSPDLLEAVAASLRWAKRTGGAFDPTVEPLVEVLGLRGPEGRVDEMSSPSMPDPPRHGPVGWRHVAIDAAAGTVSFERPGMGIDLGGIGKGIALDAAARVLRRGGAGAASLDFGGQVLVFGRAPGGGGWPVGVADPDDRDRPAGELRLREGSIATSGNGERAVGDGPRRTGHILDPARGVPAPFGGSVTVVAADGTTADALSTALFVMGPDDGRAWADRHRVAALYLWRVDGVLKSATTSVFRTDFGEWSPSHRVSVTGTGTGRGGAAGAGW